MKKFALILCSLIFFSGCNSSVEPPGVTAMKVVDKVDVKKYMGKWFEISSIPMREQEGCFATTATYTLRDDGEVDVFNECHDGKIDGPIKTAKGRAWVVDANSNAKLKVSFFWPFAGDYWVIELEPEYKYAVVGHPSRNYAWILSRTPQMDEKQYQEILSRMKSQGYDLNRLKRAIHK